MLRQWPQLGGHSGPVLGPLLGSDCGPKTGLTPFEPWGAKMRSRVELGAKGGTLKAL